MECGDTGTDLLKFCRQYVVDALHFDLRDRQLVDPAVAEEKVLQVIEKHFEHFRIPDRIALHYAIHSIIAECSLDDNWGQVCISQVVDALLGQETVPDYVVKMDMIGEEKEAQTKQGKALASLLKKVGIVGEVRIAVVYVGQEIFPIQDLEGEFSADRKIIYVIVGLEKQPGFVSLSDLLDLEDERDFIFTNDYFKALFHPLLRTKGIIT